MLVLPLLLALGTDDLAKTMLPFYTRDAAEYRIAVETAPDKPLELKKEPVFEWSNPIREGLQQGVIFVWLRDGRPAALCSVFSQPTTKPAGRQLNHEFHALAPEKLLVTRPTGLNEWKPEAGLVRKELPDAPAPAASPAARLLQMRRFAQEFTGHSNNKEGTRWDLRLLPAPLYRYPEAKTGVLDGAVFTLVSTAGTDPEVLIVVEARSEGGKAKWEYALARFSDRDLHVERKERAVWSSVRSETDTFLHDAQHLYRLYADKIIDADGKLLARVKATKKVWWGEVYPVTDK